MIRLLKRIIYKIKETNWKYKLQGSDVRIQGEIITPPQQSYNYQKINNLRRIQFNDYPARRGTIRGYRAVGDKWR